MFLWIILSFTRWQWRSVLPCASRKLSPTWGCTCLSSPRCNRWWRCLHRIEELPTWGPRGWRTSPPGLAVQECRPRLQTNKGIQVRTNKEKRDKFRFYLRCFFSINNLLNGSLAMMDPRVSSGSDSPSLFTALTRNLYSCPGVSPSTWGKKHSTD